VHAGRRPTVTPVGPPSSCMPSPSLGVSACRSPSEWQGSAHHPPGTAFHGPFACDQATSLLRHDGEVGHEAGPGRAIGTKGGWCKFDSSGGSNKGLGVQERKEDHGIATSCQRPVAPGAAGRRVENVRTQPSGPKNP